MDKEDVLNNTIWVALVGSKAFGTNSETSDDDYKGIFIADRKHYLGLSSIEQISNFENQIFSYDKVNFGKGIYNIELPDEPRDIILSRDTELFELRRLFNLALSNNPSILDVLYSPFHYVPFDTADFYNLIMDNRDSFLSTKCRFSFGGYAVQQLKKIEMHRKWLLNPPKAPPDPADWKIPYGNEINKSSMYAFFEYIYELMNLQIDYCENAQILKREFIELLKENVDYKQILREKELTPELIEYTSKFANLSKESIQIMQQIKGYVKAKDHWDSYQSWKTNRNPARAGMEERIGYDSKHGMHCIRLLRMGNEILRGKGVIVDRRIAGDAEELLYIRNGNMSYDDLMNLVKSEDERLEINYNESKLPRKPNFEVVERMCIKILEKWL